MTARVQTVTIVGMGLIGGSYGLAMRERHLAERVIGVSRREATLRAARELGACDEATADLVAGCRDSDLVILCAPVSLIPEHARIIAASVPAAAIVTDAGSTKAAIVQQCEAALAGAARFVGGHPMAGSELAGVQHARADLFEGATYAVTKTPRTEEKAFAAIERLALQLGAKPLLIDAQVHDEVVALTSHLPHLVAFALASAVWSGHADKRAIACLAASGYRDTTRVAGASAELWVDIFRQNREALLCALDTFSEELAALRTALADGDEAALLRLLQAANDGRARVMRTEP